MITKITLHEVASYKKPASLETDKKVNLIYGLNGTGKSTISNLLATPSDERFKNCSIEGADDDHQVMVYNQTFIQENFFESETIQGIFTLSKKNKDAETKIASAEERIKNIRTDREKKEREFQREKERFDQTQMNTKNKVWDIKTSYSGAERTFDFCLENLKSDKDRLLAYIDSIEKPHTKPSKSIEDLQKEANAISGASAQIYTQLSQLTFHGREIEQDEFLQKQIIGNNNSSVSELINRLNNSDWVKEGLQYIQPEQENENDSCPFCQQKTLSQKLIQSIKDYFDESYEADINKIKLFYKNYQQGYSAIDLKWTYENNPIFIENKGDIDAKYKEFQKVTENNLRTIDDKIKSPSIPVVLISSDATLAELNNSIDHINRLIAEHNTKIEQKTKVLNELNHYGL